jgi:hypothetical protein
MYIPLNDSSTKKCSLFLVLRFGKDLQNHVTEAIGLPQPVGSPTGSGQPVLANALPWPFLSDCHLGDEAFIGVDYVMMRDETHRLAQ